MAWYFVRHENGGQGLSHDPSGYLLPLTDAEVVRLRAIQKDGELLRVLFEIAGSQQRRPSDGHSALQDAFNIDERFKGDQLKEIRAVLKPDSDAGAHG
jgi:hypothetical protein